MNNLFSKIIKAGVIVGTFDILAAFIYYFIKTRGNPLHVLKFIASGIFGKQAFSGGPLVMLSGLILHYMIAFSFTVFFFWLLRKIKMFSNHKVLSGIIYGLFIWAVMNLVVV